MTNVARVLKVRQLLEQEHRRSCPLCGVDMIVPSLLPGQKRQLPNTRTKAHVYATNHIRRRNDLWIHACSGCNIDQGALALDEWLLILRHRGDRRAELVEEVVALLRREGLIA